MINVAVVGAGYWGKKLLREYDILSGKKLNLYGVADVSKEAVWNLTNELSLRSPIKTWYGDDMIYSSLLSDSNVGAVHIATPNLTHYSLAKTFLEAGKHVLLEKPMCLTSREAFKLVRLAEQKGLILHCGHIFRFNNAINIFRKKILSESIGYLYDFSFEWTTKMAKPIGRDIMFDLAPHPLDILNFILDEQPTTAYLNSKNFLPGYRDFANIVLTYPFPEYHHNVGLMANIKLTWLSHMPKRRLITVLGQSGALQCDALNQRLFEFRNGDSIPDEIEVIPNNTIADMITHFVHCIEDKAFSNNSGLVGAQIVTQIERLCGGAS